MRVHVAVIGGEGGNVDIVDPHRREAVLDPFAVEQFDADIVRGLYPPVRHQRVDIALAGAEPQIAFAAEIDRRRIAVHRHQRLELAVDLVPVLRHADVLGHGEKLPDAAGGARRRREFVGRVRFDDDHVGGMTGQRQVIGGRGADDPAADDHNLGHFPLGALLPRIVPAGGAV